MSKDLILLRGASKSTFSHTLVENFVSPIASHQTDHYFYDEEGNYHCEWEAEHLFAAKRWCYENTECDMEGGCPTVIVSNTFAQENEVTPYIALGKKYGYNVTILTVENKYEKL